MLISSGTGYEISFLCSLNVWRTRVFLPWSRHNERAGRLQGVRTAPARVFLVLLNVELDDLADRIELAVGLGRNSCVNGHLTKFPRERPSDDDGDSSY